MISEIFRGQPDPDQTGHSQETAKTPNVDRKLSIYERSEHTQRLLASYREAITAAPEVTEALRDAYFIPAYDMPPQRQSILGKNIIAFERGNSLWSLRYETTSFKESVQLARFTSRELQNNDPRTVNFQEMVIVSFPFRAKDQFTRRPGDKISYQRPPSSVKEYGGYSPVDIPAEHSLDVTTNTLKAVREAERVLEEFRNAASPQKSQTSEGK